MDAANMAINYNEVINDLLTQLAGYLIIIHDELALFETLRLDIP